MPLGETPECLASRTPASTPSSRGGGGGVVYVPTLTEIGHAAHQLRDCPPRTRLLVLWPCASTPGRRTARTCPHRRIDIAVRRSHDRRVARLPQGLAAGGLAGGGRPPDPRGAGRRHHHHRH